MKATSTARSATSRTDYRLDDGAPVVFVAGVETLWHLRAPDTGTDHAKTLCGLTGPVYAYTELAKRRRCCTVCAARAPKGALTRISQRTTRRAGRPKGKYRKITEVQIRALHLLHWEQRVSINQIAKQYYERLGYTSSRSFCSQLCGYFKQLGLPTHDRIAMCVEASTKHGLARRTTPNGGGKFGNGSKSAGYRRWLLNERAGGETRNPLCCETTARGKPCTHRALNGSDYCFVHEPARRAAVVARVTEMRARSPLHDPDLLEPAAPLAELLRDYKQSGGSWRDLARRTQLPDHYLAHIGNGHQERVDRRRAQRIRDTLLPVEAAA